MDEAQQTEVLLLDHYARGVLAGFCANSGIGEVSEEELVSKAFHLAQLALVERLRSGQAQIVNVYHVMQRDRYLRSIDKTSKTTGFIGNVRESILFFTPEKAEETAEAARGLGTPGYVRRGRAELYPNGRIIPLPVEDWKEQAMACPLEQYREEAEPAPEPAKKQGIMRTH